MAAKAYVILHGGVDAWRQGDVIPADKFAKLDTQRLLDLGAMREASADEVKAAQGPADQAAAAAPENTTGSADVPAIAPPPVSADQGKK